MRHNLHHLLLITTDQQRSDTIQTGGNRHILTPHLDWLLETGGRAIYALLFELTVLWAIPHDDHDWAARVNQRRSD